MYLQDVLYVKLEDCTALILGLGVFCQWCGLLHFLSYFESYNVSGWFEVNAWKEPMGGERGGWREARWY